MRPRRARALTGVLLLLGAAAAAACSPAAGSSTTDAADTVRVTRRDFVRARRVTGLVEAARSTTLTVPRLQGPGSGVLIVTRLVPGGTNVHAGDILVQFDPQAQERVAFDRRAEYEDFAAQVARKEAEHLASKTADESALVQAQNEMARAKLEMLKNEMLGAILVEKNEQTLAEAEASLEMLRRTFDIKRRAERAERRALEIQRDRSQAAMLHAQRNIQAMTMKAPHDGLLVLKNVWKNGQMGEVQEGEEVRPGLPLLEVVDPSRMRVRARVNQADAPLLQVGQPVSVELDAYPGRTFKGHLDGVAPAAVTSALSPRVRSFTATFTVDEVDPTLLPDLTAAVDVELERHENVLVVPREAVTTENDATLVYVAAGEEWARTPVSLGALSDTDAIVRSGLSEGAVLRREQGSRRR